MGENEESRVVSEAIENGVKTVNRLAGYFSGLVGAAQSMQELCMLSGRLTGKVMEVVTHISNNPNCYAIGVHMCAAGAITELFVTPMLMSMRSDSDLVAYKERVIAHIQTKAGERVESLRSERSHAAVAEIVKAMRDVESEIASEELLHGATKH